MNTTQPTEFFSLLKGEWDVVMTHAWFLKSMEIEMKGTASFEILDNGFLVLKQSMAPLSGVPDSTSIIGYSDAKSEFKMLYHDVRGVNRIYDMEYKENTWNLSREDTDFYQRFIGTIEKNSIKGRWEASEDKGLTWRKDFDLIYTRK